MRVKTTDRASLYFALAVVVTPKLLQEQRKNPKAAVDGCSPHPPPLRPRASKCKRFSASMVGSPAVLALWEDEAGESQVRARPWRLGETKSKNGRGELGVGVGWGCLYELRP